MYQIFESSLYLLYEKSLTSSTVKTDDVNNSTTYSDSKIKSETITAPESKSESKVIHKPEPEPEVTPKEEEYDDVESEDNFDEVAPEEDLETSPKEKFQSIQKFILYNKLRELQYKLNNVNVITNYKNKDELVKFNKFLSYVIQFFSIFDYAQASQITQRLLDEFKKIK